MIDELINFDNHNTNLDLLFSSLNPAYKTYDNSFDFVDKDVLKEKIKSSIKLSYTSLSTFYKCQFRYYLERVLYLNRSEDTNAIMIGNMFHAILEKYGTEGFDLEAERQKQYDSITDISTRFYFNKLWPDFLLALEVIDEFREVTYLKDELHEQEVNIDLSDDYFTKVFTGKIDKIIYKTIDGVDYVSIIDYKTGKDIPSLDNVADGFNLQLPVYAYFLAKTELLKNPKILGIYLQRILNNSKPTKTKDLLTVQKDALKLDGYSTVDKKDLALLDPNYSKSSYIKSMSLLKDGSFNRYAKVFSAGDINDLIKMVEELINEAFSDIEQGNFNINPKSIKGNNKSCQFCPSMNICYRKNKDIKVIDVKKFKETVGDEDGLL
jgi:ATP-dependent helicase/DNAse subunit B